MRWDQRIDVVGDALGIDQEADFSGERCDEAIQFRVALKGHTIGREVRANFLWYLSWVYEDDCFLLADVAKAYSYGIEGNIIASYIEDPSQLIDHRDDRSIGTLSTELASDCLDAFLRTSS